MNSCVSLYGTLYGTLYLNRNIGAVRLYNLLYIDSSLNLILSIRRLEN